MYPKGGANPDKLYGAIQGILTSQRSAGILSSEWVGQFAVAVATKIEEIWGPGEAEEARALRELAAAVRELREGIDVHGKDSVLDTPAIFFDQVWRAERRLQEVRRKNG